MDNLLSVQEKIQKVLEKEPWISETWEPYLKCEPEERENFVLALNLFSEFAPKSLGTIDVRFEKCSPYRSFSIQETVTELTFMDVIVEKALGKEKELEDGK